MLVIDDLQFLQGKSTQAEFCHTLNALIDAGRRAVIAADRPPSDLESLDDRVRSRWPAASSWRWVRSAKNCAGIEVARGGCACASRELRRAGSGADYLARTITHNGRDLEGAINRLLAHSKLNAQPVTLEMAEAGADLIRPQEPKGSRSRTSSSGRPAIQCQPFGLAMSRRTANVVRPRQVAMYLAKTLTLRSLPEIGRRLADATTPRCHAVQEQALVARDTALSEEVESLKRHYE